MQKKNKFFTVTMCSPNQIATMNYNGCKTPQSVISFCTRYGVNRFWWTPSTGTGKVLLIDLQNFSSCWTQAYCKNITKTYPTTTGKNCYGPKSNTKSTGTMKTGTTKMTKKSGSSFGNYKVNKTTGNYKYKTTGTYKTHGTKTRRAA